jgi:hypothetical protein
MEYVFAYDSSVEVFYIGSDKKTVLADALHILSVDRMSTIRYRLAKILKLEPEHIYVEIKSADRLILPFSYFVDDAIAR